MNMDYGKAFTFVFEDKNWVTKLLIGGILTLIPVVNFVAIGYGLRVLKNVAEGAEEPLPEWSDFADHFVQGVVSSLCGLVWAIPAILLSLVIGFISAATGYEGDPQGVAVPIWLCVSSLSCLSGLYGMFLGVVTPAAMTQYAVSGEFVAVFRFGQIFKYITSNLGPYIIALLLGLVAAFIAGFGLVFCGVGVAFTGFWALLVASYLFGQVYEASELAVPEVVA
jgi:hypothetical protein